MAEKFFNKFYHEIKPRISKRVEAGMRIPKSLPSLPETVAIQGQIGNIQMPSTDSLIDIASVRRSIDPPTGKGYCAVVIDSGVFEHPMLPGTIIGKFSANGDPHDTEDLYGHGTHLAGIIAARGSVIPGMGIAPEASIISIKVTRKNSGCASWASIYRALNMVISMVTSPDTSLKANAKIGVVNLAFNGLDKTKGMGMFSNHYIFNALRELHKRNIPVVISGGNAYEDIPGTGLGYPACSPYAMHAAAVFNYPFEGFDEGSLCTFSQRRISNMSAGAPEDMVKEHQKGFISAPGACSISLNNSNDPKRIYSYLSGSSVSAAILSGAILLIQDSEKKKPVGGLPVDSIMNILAKASTVYQNTGTARPSAVGTSSTGRFFDNKSYCRLNVRKSVGL